MVSYPIPTIGMKGFYSLKAPFDSLLSPLTEYSCRAIRQLNDLVINQEDPLTTIYLAIGLTESEYKQDLASDVSIVTLQAGNGQWVIVPASYILSYPETSGVAYHGLMLAVNLGAVEVAYDSTPLQAAISNLVYDHTGVYPDINTVEISTVKIVPYDTHTSIQTARESRKTLQLSDRAKLGILQTQLDTALQKITQLEAYIKQKILA